MTSNQEMDLAYSTALEADTGLILWTTCVITISVMSENAHNLTELMRWLQS